MSPPRALKLGTLVPSHHRTRKLDPKTAQSSKLAWELSSNSFSSVEGLFQDSGLFLLPELLHPGLVLLDWASQSFGGLTGEDVETVGDVDAMKLNERSVAHYATSNSPADHTGYLCKRVERHHHHHTTSYHRRWFILKGNLLFYFEEQESREPLGLIVLEGCTVELCEAAEEFAFAICFDGTGGKAYVLVASSQAAMEAWVKALSRASFAYMRLVVKELEKQLEEAQKSLVACHKLPKKSSTGRKRHLSNPAMVPVQEHPAGLENGYSTWDSGCSVAGVIYWDDDRGCLKPPPLPPRRRLAWSNVGGALVPGHGSIGQDSPVSPETACFSKLHDWYGQEIAEIRKAWLESQEATKT